MAFASSICCSINENWFNGIFRIRNVQESDFPFFPSTLSRKAELERTLLKLLEKAWLLSSWKE